MCRAERRVVTYNEQNIRDYLDKPIKECRITLVYVLKFTHRTSKDKFIKFGITVQTIASQILWE
jgi:hypothetical protein